MSFYEIRDVPVKTPDGKEIGKAKLRVDDGGNITAEMKLDSNLGKEVMTAMEVGLVDGLSLAPITTPAIETTSVMDPHRSFEHEIQFVDAVSAFPNLDTNVHRGFETLEDYVRFTEEMVFHSNPKPPPTENISFGPEEIESRFGFHKASLEGPNATAPKHAEARRNFKAFAKWFDEYAPHSREKEVAMERLEEASMWFHKAIAKDAPLSKD